MMIFKVSEQFTDAPGGRLRKHGPKSGEELRDDFLIPLLRSNPNEKLVIDFDGIYGIGISTLDEIFYGIGKCFGESIINRIEIKSDEEPELIEASMKCMMEGTLEN